MGLFFVKKGTQLSRFIIKNLCLIRLCLAYKILGERIWDRLGVEPSGTGFNSLTQLEKDNGIPRNPFVNAGAIVISDVLLSNLKNPKKDLLDFIRSLSANQDINYSANL